MNEDLFGERQKAENGLVLSFLSVRRAIGLLGYFLPAALILWSLTYGAGFKSSMSAYFYTPMSDIFVGSLCATAVFLWSYEGFRPRGAEIISDKMTARIAALGALGVALAPKLPDEGPAMCSVLQCIFGVGPVAIVHYIGAALFFGALAVFCLILFVRGSVETEEKRASNRIYRICGWTILASMALMALAKWGPLGDLVADLHPIFWLETLATLAFATSWMVKGDALRGLVDLAAGGAETETHEI